MSDDQQTDYFSDDEPYHQQPGDLCPLLCIDDHVMALKKIISAGTHLPAVEHNSIVIYTYNSQTFSSKFMNISDILIRQALLFMQIGETAELFVANAFDSSDKQKIALKDFKKLEKLRILSMRRRFIDNTEQMQSYGVLTLQNVENHLNFEEIVHELINRVECSLRINKSMVIQLNISDVDKKYEQALVLNLNDPLYEELITILEQFKLGDVCEFDFTSASFVIVNKLKKIILASVSDPMIKKVFYSLKIWLVSFHSACEIKYFDFKCNSFTNKKTDCKIVQKVYPGQTHIHYYEPNDIIKGIFSFNKTKTNFSFIYKRDRSIPLALQHIMVRSVIGSQVTLTCPAHQFDGFHNPKLERFNWFHSLTKLWISELNSLISSVLENYETKSEACTAFDSHINFKELHNGIEFQVLTIEKPSLTFYNMTRNESIIEVIQLLKQIKPNPHNTDDYHINIYLIEDLAKQCKFYLYGMQNTLNFTKKSCLVNQKNKKTLQTGSQTNDLNNNSQNKIQNIFQEIILLAELITNSNERTLEQTFTKIKELPCDRKTVPEIAKLMIDKFFMFNMYDLCLKVIEFFNELTVSSEYVEIENICKEKIDGYSKSYKLMCQNMMQFLASTN